jgi:MoaA/NifB/PqqE/SkfB family radical SAM enzyme
MDITQLKKVELEITSNCNAACPGCARTIAVENGSLEPHGEDFTLDDLKRMFPPGDYTGVEFKFCGVLGDPAIHPQFADMLEYLLENNGKTSISTNGAVGTADMWRRIGKICNAHQKRFHLHWCIDGHKETNHIYRVNTVWKVLERNMNAFVETVGEYVYRAKWVYIVFDHNEHELDAAREHANRLGFNFATRTGMRNSFHQWTAKIKKKDKEKKKVVTTEKVITTTGKKEHSKLDQVKELDKFIANENKTKEETVKVLNSIQCKYVHEAEIFISADQTMWPCCFLADWGRKNNDNILDKLAEYGTGWNSLRDKGVSEIMRHPWFEKILADSWDPNHPKHLKRCIRTCAYNKAYHNELIDEAK